ncbi:MAG: fructose-6-phosphate aldolase [Methylocystaceae bacterium]
MQIYIDTADLIEIKRVLDMGVLAGVTTNPSLVAKQGGDYHSLIAEICTLVDGPVSAEVIASDCPGMLAEAEALAAISPQVVVKVPLTEPGLQAISQLHQRGIPTNATLIFSPNQALLAARAGASYVSPFIGRLDDAGNDGLATLEQILTIIKQHDLPTKVIAASIRHPQHVATAAMMGCHIATIPYSIMLQLISHPLTTAGIAKFDQDWQQAFGKR